MTYQAILLVSCLLLVAFGVERLSKSTGIPAVIVMIGMGLLGKPLLASFGVELGGIHAAVSVLGTVGLVLIVLEGAFDLQLRRDRLRTASQAFVSAVLGLVAWAALFSAMGVWALGLPPFHAFLLAMPFSVISSAVAIPSSSFLRPSGREFVVYESSISDILGVLIFFAALSSDQTFEGVLLNLANTGLVSLLLGGVCAVGLLFGLVKLGGHIRFVPLLANLFALYAVGKLLHLSPLIMVLMFGLILNNPALFSRLGILRKVMTDEGFGATVREFKTLTGELTFAVRGVFFVLLGYWTDLGSLTSLQAWTGAALGLLGIYGVRRLLLNILRVDMAAALTWIAPRGLITVLLFLSVKDVVSLPAYLDGILMLMVMFSALLLGLGRWAARDTPAR